MMTGLFVILSVAAFFGGSQALAIERRPEDALLDEWLHEQMEDPAGTSPEANAAEDFGDPPPAGEDLGYATPGHAEEHDYMTAFFDNQDHDAFADFQDSAGYQTNPQIEKYLADFFGFSETTTPDEDSQPDTLPESYPWAQDSPVVTPVNGQGGPSPYDNIEEYVDNYFNTQRQSSVLETSKYEAEREGSRVGLNGQRVLPEYVANYFNTQRQSAVQGIPETGAENLPVGAPSPSDIEEYVASSQRQSAAAQETETDSPVVAPVNGQGGPSPYDNIEDYVANYFNTQRQSSVQETPETSVQETPETGYGHPVPGATVRAKEANDYGNMQKDEVTKGGVNNYFDSFGGWTDSHQEATSQNLLADDLEMWLQAMTEHDNAGEDVEEEEDVEDRDISKLNVNFMDDFPEEVFSEDMQASLMQMDSECLQWKERIESGHKTMWELGNRMQDKMRAYKTAMEAYNARKNVSCERDCEMKCIPTRSEDKCIQMVNGSCISRVPQINDCGMKQRDPGCEAEEARCESRLKPLVEEMERARRNVGQAKEELNTEIRNRRMMLEKIPQRCLEEKVGDGTEEEGTVVKRSEGYLAE